MKARPRSLAHLDVPISKAARMIQSKALQGKSKKAIAEETKYSDVTVHASLKDVDVTRPIYAADLARTREMREILDFCKDIIKKPAQTPLKYSDKLAAARLFAEISGLLKEDTQHNINVEIVDLRQATEAELRAELALLEDQAREQANSLDKPE